MREVTLHYHLFLPVLLSFFFLLLLCYKRKSFLAKTNQSLFMATVFFFALYILIVGRALYLDIFLQWELNKFDTDKNGFFTGNEITEEQQLAMKKLVSDTGRNFSFIVGFVFSFIAAAILFLISFVLTKIKKSITH